MSRTEIIDTLINIVIATKDLPDGSSGVVSTPDGTKLFISNNAQANAYYFVLNNGLPTTLSPSPVDITGHSNTAGNFAG